MTLPSTSWAYPTLNTCGIKRAVQTENGEISISEDGVQTPTGIN
jgi:hypothetical protein